MQIDETVHGCPVAVVHPIVRLEIPKSNPDHLGIAAFGCGPQAALLDSPDRRTLPKNGGHWPVLRPGSSDLAALNRVSKPRIVGFRARIGGFSTRDEPLPPVAGTA